MAKKQTRQELAQDITHAVNTLICLARDGEYAKPKSMALYGKFKSMLKKLEEYKEHGNPD